MSNAHAQAHEKAGPSILKALPADTNPKMRDQLMAAISEGGAALAASQGAQVWFLPFLDLPALI